MAWEETTRTLLRAIINDIDAQTYSNARLDTMIINASYLVYGDIDFDTTYTINIVDETISPDPTSISDDSFTTLSVLKAACMIDHGIYRDKLAITGLMAKLGPAVLNTDKHSEGYAKLLTISGGPCELYETAKNDAIFGNGSICKAILSPFVGNNFDPLNLGTYDSSARDRQ